MNICARGGDYDSGPIIFAERANTITAKKETEGCAVRAYCRGGFEGWYFKHQSGGYTVSFIPGRTGQGAFVQMIEPGASRVFPVPSLSEELGVIRAGDCVFSRRGAVVELPGVSGEITYGANTPLQSDIMGPFAHLPMECRHGVVSMSHPLRGGLTVDGARHSLDGGLGYIERDGGVSFPERYIWLQCLDAASDCSVMMSAARIPFGPCGFTGCICAAVCGGREYRLATYNGARVHSASPEHICVSRGALLLEADVLLAGETAELKAPVRGRMTGRVGESLSAVARVRLLCGGRAVFDIQRGEASFEYVPPRGKEGQIAPVNLSGGMI